MAEYITKEQAKDICGLMSSFHERTQYLKSKIDELPAADVAPVVYARWKWTWDTCSMGSVQILRCSHCLRELKRAGKYEGNYPPYCQYCGAKMDGGGKR